jgi:molybdopterin-guanine dinucleotide biosynthesis protein A
MNGARVLLLAAGHGRRAGGPKAWRKFAGKTLLEVQLDFFRGLVGPAGISVAIQDEWRERCVKLSPETVWAAANPDSTPLDSLQRLIAASPSARSFVLHVDMPVFGRSIYESLLNATGDAVVPTFDGHRGHPVLLSPVALDEIKRLDPVTGRLDSWLRKTHTIEVAVSTDAIFRNMNEAAA